MSARKNLFSKNLMNLPSWAALVQKIVPGTEQDIHGQKPVETVQQ
jgi:hypothetical protein